MSIQFVGNHAVPPEVTRVAADSGLGDVQAVYQVPHGVLAEGEAAKAKRTELRNGLLTIAAMGLPLLTALLLWWATGSIGTGIGVGAVVAIVGFGVSFAVMGKGDKGKLGERDRVYLCGDGFVLPAEDEAPARAFRWSDFTAIHRVVTDNYVNGQHIYTGYSFRLVLADRAHVHFGGVELPKKQSATEILKLAPVLEEEIFSRRLPLAVEAVNAGGTVAFGELAISASGVTTPKGYLPWNRVGDLSVGAGNLVLGAAGSRPATYPIGDIPNFAVFWTLAQNLHAHHAG